MREQDAVVLIYLPVTLLLYVLFSGHSLSAILGRPPPLRLRGHIERVFRGTQLSFRKAVGVYAGWTAFTQLAPLVVTLSDATGYIRAAGAIELVAAAGWTAYLLRAN
jgi:hypothetical protein